MVKLLWRWTFGWYFYRQWRRYTRAGVQKLALYPEGTLGYERGELLLKYAELMRSFMMAGEEND